MINNHNDEINNILNLYHSNKLSEYNMNNKSDNAKYDILYFLLIKIKNNYINGNKNYKMENYYNLYEYIINNNFQIFINNRNLLLILFTKITVLIKGHILINKFINSFDNIKLVKNELIDLLLIAGSHGSFLSFLLWLNIYNKSNEYILNNTINLTYNLTDHLKPDIFTTRLLLNSIGNSDDRIYKYLLDIDNINLILNTSVALSLINNLGNSIYIPVKYKLKRLKRLSQKINLDKFFFDMIIKFTDNQSLYLLHKYYYINTDNIYTISAINNLLSYINFIHIEYLKFYNILKTNTEKILYLIICSLKYNYHNKINYDKKLLESIIINNNYYIINFIYNSYDWKTFIENIDLNLNNQILKVLCNNNLITKYIENYSILNYTHIININILRFTKFLIIHNKNNSIYKYAISNNLILHNLRLFVNKKRNNKFIIHKYKTLEIIHEINNIKSQDNIIIFKNNSYQIINLQFYNKNKFKNIFIDNELDNNFNIIPYDHYPPYELLNIYNTIDTNYDEDNDLYIINDINIPNTSFIDRYLLLLQYHDFISFKSINTISNINEFNNLLIKYKSELNEFKKKSDSIKWFPNFICIII